MRKDSYYNAMCSPIHTKYKKFNSKRIIYNVEDAPNSRPHSLGFMMKMSREVIFRLMTRS
jgi:hypothetical protein